MKSRKILIGCLTSGLMLGAAMAEASTWGSSQTDTAATGWLTFSQVSQIDVISGTSNAVAASGACTSGQTYRWRKLTTYTMFTPARYFLTVYNQTCS